MKRLLVNIMLACLPVVGVSAYDCMVDGICYNLSNGEAAVTSKTPKYSGNIVIPSTIEYNNNTYQVTSIEGGAFSECSNLTVINLPNSLKTIGGNAFEGCGLTSISIPNSVESIGAYAFSLCPLTNFVIEDGYTTLRFKDTEKPFYSWINMPGDGDYAEILPLENVYIGRNIDSNRSSREWFHGMTSLKTLTIGNAVTEIPDGSWGFCYGCSSLESLTIGSSLTKIGGQDFYGCTSLTTLNIPDNVLSIGSYAFYGCDGLTTASIGSGSIGENAFSSCTALSSLTLGNNVTNISIGAFSGCPISSIFIPNNVVRIAGGAFGSVKELTIEDGDETLECYLGGMGPLEQVYLGRNVPEQSSGLGGIIRESSTLCSLTIGENVKHIPYAAFSNCSSLTTLTLGEGVTSIGESAFEGCSSLPSITLPNSLTTIGENAFYNATSLQTIVIPNSVTDIGDGAFYGCSNLSTLDIQATSLIINSDWFIGCDNIATVSIAGGTIGEWGFANKTKLTSLTLGDGVTCIGKSAFYGCSSLPSVTLPNSLVTIGESAFAGTTSLQTIVIPNSVTCIGESAFCNTTSLQTISIPNSVTAIGSSAFYNSGALNAIHITDMAAWCGIAFGEKWNGYSSDEGFNLYLNDEKVTRLLIPKEATKVNPLAFYNCKDIESITVEEGNEVYDSRQDCNAIIETESNTLLKGCKNSFVPTDVTAIADYAFLNCDGLTAVTLGREMQSIGQQAFDGCKLRNVLVKNATPPTASGSSFSAQTFYHTTLYIPTGSWDDYAYDDSWYCFINIRETATTEAQLTMQQAYTLMDANQFCYSVYDPVNDCIGTISTVSGIDENNPNHCWQVIEADGSHYLYNIGAKKFVTTSVENSNLVLSDNIAPISMEDGTDGIVLDNDSSQQWAMVSNERMLVDQNIISEVTGIQAVSIDREQGTRYYDLNGRQLQQLQKGLNIIRTANGKIVKKVF